MSGTLYGLGIGPGDPDLITVKAKDILARVPVIAYPAPEGAESLVRRIAAPYLPAGRTEIVIATPMAAHRFPAQDVYDRYAAILADHLAEGCDVAVLCEGDPFLYGSFMYLYQRLAVRYRTIVVPGVSSLAAVAAVSGRPLCERNEALVVLPAPLPEAELEALLRTADAAAIMKVGRHLTKVRRVLRRLDREQEAIYVARATFPDQRVVPLAELADGDVAPYFSMILVRGQRPGGTREHLPEGAAIIALSEAGQQLGRRLQALLPASQVHGRIGRTSGGDVAFADTAAHLRQLFTAGTPIVGIAAAGILIRAIAPLLTDKRLEPPVVAVAEDGGCAVPLLGGHGGGNRLARAIAFATGGRAAITTAGDLRFGFGLDDPPAGWRLANPVMAKEITAALLAGKRTRLQVEAGDGRWLAASGAPFATDGSAPSDGTAKVRITHKRPGDEPATLVLHPPVLAVGVGCERGTDPAEVLALVGSTLARNDLAAGSIACVASLDLKMDEPAIEAAGRALGIPIRYFASPELERETPRLATPSAIVFREVGCHGVAEAAALAAAGPEATLVIAKQRSPRATCAVAKAPRDIDVAAVGRARGRLTIVGIGPGQAAWRTPEVTRVLAEATDIVGYRLYLELIGDLAAGKRLHASPLTREEVRARLALDLAAVGNRVALVGSGDAGVYGLATLVFELLDRDPAASWQRIAIDVAPGLSALLAAAARAGAPLGHDFCAISLSDLLTPWPEIERRLQAAAAADFVVALYNPVSQRRQSQLARARDILLGERPATTPVVLARNIGRDAESVCFVRLAELDVADADMLTLVIVGSSRTQLFRHGGRQWIYTPRGYARKISLAEAGE